MKNLAVPLYRSIAQWNQVPVLRATTLFKSIINDPSISSWISAEPSALMRAKRSVPWPNKQAYPAPVRLHQPSIVKSPVPKSQSAESGIERLLLAPGIKALAVPNFLSAVST